MEAMRCLKRRISDAIYRQLVADAHAAAEAASPVDSAVSAGLANSPQFPSPRLGLGCELGRGLDPPGRSRERRTGMGNWVIICHGRARGVGPVQVPADSELTFWVNEGQEASVAAAALIVTELMRNPVDVDSLQQLITKAWPDHKVDWSRTSGAGGQWVEDLDLKGDADIECVGVLDLTSRQFTRWADGRSTLGRVLGQYSGNVHMICCR